MSVPCSQLLIGHSNVVVDFQPRNVEPHFASEAEILDEYDVFVAENWPVKEIIIFFVPLLDAHAERITNPFVVTI